MQVSANELVPELTVRSTKIPTRRMAEEEGKPRTSRSRGASAATLGAAKEGAAGEEAEGD